MQDVEIANLLDDYHWLTSPAAHELLEAAAASKQSPLSQLASLRKVCSPERARLVVEQAALRRRALAKFAAAERMFFAARALEQATDEVVAEHKAQRFDKAARVFDLCCGIGGDLLALAKGREAVGIDRDAIMAHLAGANARALFGEAGRPQVWLRDVAEVDVAECAAWHLDPDRRPQGRRTTRVELHEPSVETIERLLARNPHAGIKLAPAAQWPPHWNNIAELEWISRARECRQLVAWFGNLARKAGHRAASILSATGAGCRTIVGNPIDSPIRGGIGRYVFEPDAAVLAARLSGVLAAEHGLAAISAGNSYLTGEQAVDDTALACFEVLEVLPFRLKAVKELLRSRRVGQLEIKKRGVELDPAALHKQLKPSGTGSATLLLTRVGKSVTAILARRDS